MEGWEMRLSNRREMSSGAKKLGFCQRGPEEF